MRKDKPARLILENGVVFHGKSLGSEESSSGEVVFNLQYERERKDKKINNLYQRNYL